MTLAREGRQRSLDPPEAAGGDKSWNLPDKARDVLRIVPGIEFLLFLGGSIVPWNEDVSRLGSAIISGLGINLLIEPKMEIRESYGDGSFTTYAPIQFYRTSSIFIWIPPAINNKTSLQAPQLLHFFNFLLYHLSGLSCIVIQWESSDIIHFRDDVRVFDHFFQGLVPYVHNMRRQVRRPRNTMPI